MTYVTEAVAEEQVFVAVVVVLGLIGGHVGRNAVGEADQRSWGRSLGTAAQ